MSNSKPNFPTVIKTSISSIPKHPRNICDENQLKVAFYNEEQDHSPSHLKFFLLIFAKDKTQAQAQEGQSPQKPKDHPMKGKAKF